MKVWGFPEMNDFRLLFNGLEKSLANE